MKMSPRVISTFLYPFLQINNLILTSSLNHLVKLTSIVFVAYSNDQCLDTFGNPTAVNTVIASLLKHPLLIAHDSISLPFLLSTPNSRPFASPTFLDMPLKWMFLKVQFLVYFLTFLYPHHLTPSLDSATTHTKIFKRYVSEFS